MKNHLILLLTLITISNINAQFYLEFNSGYAKGINNKKAFENENSYTNKDYYNLDTSNYSQYNLAQGFFIEPRVGYKINNWLSASVGFYYNNNYKWNGYGNTINHFDNNEYIEMFYVSDSIQRSVLYHNTYSSIYSSKTIALTPEISLSKQINKFDIKLNIGLNISNSIIYFETDTNQTKYLSTLITFPDTSLSGGEKTITNTEYKYQLMNNFNISARIGLELSYHINNNFIILTKFYYNNLKLTPNKKKQYCYHSSKYISYLNPDYQGISGTDNVLDEVINEKDIEGDTFGMNTLQFSVGIRYIFNTKKTK